MKANKTMMYSALAGVLALGATALHPSEATAAGMEKCYGIAKAGKNDCATGQSSCAGTAKKDGLPYTFVVVPEGTCDKIVGGSTKPEESQG
ncbi:MAG: DUF2282 domain-containing protein [Gammaproteobacteria bacterium]|nr:DUF2282 domain-containing protein [Gammaproteobacteria bacterium]NIR82781.1 DUF2282 domain-containing protein [Gammaproteobacteria bacterium]NIR89645.1 DUF2282 domain-containing protein [Gammaproteobacteria bacterium]NIU03941.1 DUF2282 domain-containing protein [Gammaproteobacteria bacterium]NIV51257.1 DUF2282 domain-containing protein [Gammaproteobacteria bacterium]